MTSKDPAQSAGRWCSACQQMVFKQCRADPHSCPFNWHAISAAKTTSERVDKLRQERAALGLKRLELYAHPEDWPAIKALAERLQRKRAKLLAPPRAG